MSSELYKVAPLLRLPLFINVSVGLLLSCLRTFLDWRMNATGVVMLFLFAISTGMTLIFAYSDHRRGAIKLPHDRKFVPTNIIKGLGDTAMGVALFLIHIINTIVLSNSWGSDNIFSMYCGVGALSAR